MKDSAEETGDFVRRGYDAIADAYEEARRAAEHDLVYLDQLAGQVPPGARVLDVGCGSGVPVTRHLAAAGLEVTGIDISEAQIELARRNVPGSTFLVRDMTLLRAGEFEVDAVVAFYSIFHTPRAGHLELLKTLRSFLPKGGRLLCTFGTTDWEGEEPFFGVPMRWSHFGAEESTQLIANAGFGIDVAEIVSHTFDGELEQHLVVAAVAGS